MNYRLTEKSLDQTPIRLVDIGAWPERNSALEVVGYCEWFDWSELFVEGAPESLSRICKEFDTSLVQMACLAIDGPSERITSLKVIEIESKHLSSSYFEAIWDDQSTSFGRLAAMARIVAVWDPKERWVVVSDRFYEIGVFAVLDNDVHPFKSSFFNQLDQQELLSRFSRILRIDRDAALMKVERWKGRWDYGLR